MSLIKSKQRVADHGAVFTPLWLVEAMLDLVKGETERIDSRFLEPACGSGNFLVPLALRGVKTEGPFAKDIDTSKQRPAEFAFSRHVEHKLAEIREAKYTPHLEAAE